MPCILSDIILQNDMMHKKYFQVCRRKKETDISKGFSIWEWIFPSYVRRAKKIHTRRYGPWRRADLNRLPFECHSNALARWATSPIKGFSFLFCQYCHRILIEFQGGNSEKEKLREWKYCSLTCPFKELQSEQNASLHSQTLEPDHWAWRYRRLGRLLSPICFCPILPCHVHDHLRVSQCPTDKQSRRSSFRNFSHSLRNIGPMRFPEHLLLHPHLPQSLWKDSRRIQKADKVSRLYRYQLRQWSLSWSSRWWY